MKWLYTLPFLSLIGLNSGAALSPATESRIQAAKTCDTGTNCHELGDNTRDYTATSIELIGVGEETGKGCCFTYALRHSSQDGNDDCSDPAKPRGLSHLDIDLFCDGLNPVITYSNPNTATIGIDGSTCYNGLKWDTGLENASRDFKVCLTWDGFQVGSGCRTKESWYMMKSQTYDFEEIQVPQCAQDGPTCTAQGAGLIPTPHRCVCVDSLECPVDGSYCNSIGFVANRMSEGNAVTDDCAEDQRCCCYCTNCAPLS